MESKRWTDEEEKAARKAGRWDNTVNPETVRPRKALSLVGLAQYKQFDRIYGSGSDHAPEQP